MIPEQEKSKALLQWLKLHQKNRTLADLLKERNIERVGICGYRDYGKLVCQELLQTDILIDFILERNHEAMAVLYADLGISIVGFEECAKYKQVQTLLVTPDLDDAIVKEGLELADISITILPLTTLLNE